MIRKSTTKQYRILSAGLSLLTTTCACLILSLWLYRTGLRTFWSQPVPLGGDGLGTAHYIKLFNESPVSNLFEPVETSSSGWPFLQQSQYFPTGLWIELSIIRLYSAITHIVDPAVLLKTFVILRVIPIAVSTWFFGRAIRLTHFACFTIAVCFSTSTFNIIRAFGHFGLGMTWTVPAISTILIISSKDLIGLTNNQKPKSRLEISLATAVMFLCGLSGFYYSIFGLLLGLVIVVVILCRRVTSPRIKPYLSTELVQPQMFQGMAGLLLALVGLLAGFLLQVVPNVLAQRASPPLISTAARSWTEAIVYSGSPETLFYDFHALILQAFSLPGVLNFLQTRSTWEARQIGAIAGAAAYLFLLVFVLRVFRVGPDKKQIESPDVSNSDVVSLLRTLLVIALSLYFVGPVSFGLSRTALPFIRAWGRFAPYLTLFLVALLLLVIQRLRRSAVRFLLCALILFVQVFEINFYRNTFPDGRTLAAAATESRMSRESTIDDLARSLRSNCSLVQLPIYPYPEFDSPRDSNGDYGLFELPLVDAQIFRWSYGAIKNTEAARHYSPFVSQQPPFARISLGQQIQYWAALRPCAVVIDRTYLYVEEQRELDQIQERSRPECVRPLKGENFNDSARFVMIDFSEAICRPKIGTLTKQLVAMANSNEILWQPMTIGIERFERYWAMIPAGSTHQLMYSVRGRRTSLDVRISILVMRAESPLANQSVELCITVQETKCNQVMTNNAGLAELPLTLFASDELNSILLISLTTTEKSPIEWGALFLPVTPDLSN